MLLLGLAGVLVATGTIWAVAHLIATRNRVQNVVLICMDTVRYDTFWLPEKLGIRDDFTPWAQKAIRFRNAHSTSSWTMPAVASVFSGLYPVEHATGQFQYPVADLDAMRPSAMPPAVVTFPELLLEKKFATAAINSNPWLENVSVLDGITSEVFSKEELVTPASVDELQRLARAKERFFFYAHYMDAHGDRPLVEKRAVAATMDRALRARVVASAPAEACKDPNSDVCVSYVSYVQSILNIRKGVARILNTIAEEHRDRETAVVLFADHGEEFTDHLKEEKLRGNDPRGMYGVGHGHTLYEELLHVPILAWHPSFSNVDVTAPVSLIDVMPTLMDWVGIPAPTRSGVSVAEIKALNGDARLRDRTLFASGIAYGTQKFAEIHDGWKLIVSVCPATHRLFDLNHDPDEKHIVSDQRRVLTQADASLDAYRRRKPVAKPTEVALSDEQVRSLQAVGYLKSDANPARAQKVDCSGRMDHFDSVGEYDPEEGTFILRLNWTTDTKARVATSVRGFPIAADWKGTGTAGVGLYKDSEQTFYLYQDASEKEKPLTVKFTPDGEKTGDVPIAGDWNGDGTATIGIYRPSTSTFYLRNSNTPGPADIVLPFGIPGDKPVVGDWTGRGQTLVGVFRPSIATFFLLEGFQPTSATRTVAYGLVGDVPLAGDWNGDGRDTVGVFRPDTQTFYLRNDNSVGDADIVLYFGGKTTSIPIVGRWPEENEPHV